MCTATWVSAPARSGTIFARISSSQPCCSASWNRCPSARVISASAFFPSASSTAWTAAAHSGVRLPRITPGTLECGADLHVPVVEPVIVPVGP